MNTQALRLDKTLAKEKGRPTPDYMGGNGWKKGEKVLVAMQSQSRSLNPLGFCHSWSPETPWWF